jgi:hypothetical protein
MAVKNFTKSNFNPRGFQLVETIYYTSNATFTKATYPWLRAMRVRLVGGGGGGGGAATTGASENAIGGHGGGACYAESFITDIAGLSASITITCGAGGAGGSAGANGGTGGGVSSFGSLVSANGGLEGGAGVSAAAGLQSFRNNSDGNATGTGDLVIPGSASQPSYYVNSTSLMTSASGASFLGGARRGSAANGNGIAGRDFGGGGTGGANTQNQATARSGGAGGAGIVIVELYA